MQESGNNSTNSDDIRVRFQNCITDKKWDDMIQFLRSDTETTARKEELLTMLSSPYSPNSFFQLIKRIVADENDSNISSSSKNSSDEDQARTKAQARARARARADSQVVKELLFTIVELGGKDLIMTTRGTYAGGFRNGTILHAVAYTCKDAVDIVMKLISIGGRELVLEKNGCGGTALHEACFGVNRSSVGVISALIDAGSVARATDGASDGDGDGDGTNEGNDLLMLKDTIGQNSLHIACHCNASVDVIMTLINAGGKKLALEKNYRGSNALVVCFATNRASVDVIRKLIDVGGKDILLAKNEFGRSALHIACNNNASIEKIMSLIDEGRGDILAQMDDGHKSPLHFLICDEVNGRLFDRHRIVEQTAEKIAVLISEGIRYSIGGEFGIGGLFNSAPEQIQEQMYFKWNDRILPSLIRVVDSRQPILHAALFNKAPLNVIGDIIEHFSDCIRVRDSMGRYPVDVAISLGRRWNDGIKELTEAFASAQGCTIIHVCTKHALRWDNGLKDMLEESDGGGGEIIEEQDSSTGLYPFMKAGVGSYDLGSIFQLIQKCPGLVHLYNSEGTSNSLSIQKLSRSSAAAATTRGGEIVQEEIHKRRRIII